MCMRAPHLWAAVCNLLVLNSSSLKAIFFLTTAMCSSSRRPVRFKLHKRTFKYSESHTARSIGFKIHLVKVSMTCDNFFSFCSHFSFASAASWLKRRVSLTFPSSSTLSSTSRYTTPPRESSRAILPPGVRINFTEVHLLVISSLSCSIDCICCAFSHSLHVITKQKDLH